MMDTPVAHSSRRILQATAIAAAIALVVLLVAVLPAEYDIDPLGTGKALGLTALADTEEEGDGTPAPSALEAVRGGVNTAQQGTLAQDTFTVELRPFEGVEYKYRVEQGGSLVYSWTATGDVGFDFHGEPDGAPANASESYGKGEARSARGVFIAPTPGVHGWFWENTGSGRVAITLTTSGFYSASTEYRDGERRERTFGSD